MKIGKQLTGEKKDKRNRTQNAISMREAAASEKKGTETSTRQGKLAEIED